MANTANRNGAKFLDFCGFVRGFVPRGDSHIKRAGMLVVPLRGQNPGFLVPLRVFKAKYLHLHTTRYILGVPRSIEWHFI